MKTKNLIYFGSPDFSAAILEVILKEASVQVVGVVTSPDKATGRKQLLTPTPVGSLAEKYDLPVYKPAKLDDDNLAHLKLTNPDIFLVVSYGKIIPKSWLETPSIGTFNIHFSLLPKYRGALPISEAIKNQDNETGVTLMVMDEQLDHGPIVATKKVGIDIDDDLESLTNKLTQAAITLITTNLPGLASAKFESTPQDETEATLTPQTKTRNRDSAHIDWETLKRAIGGKDAAKVHALVRSNNPDPGAWTKIDDLELKIVKTSLTDSRLEINTVQLPGKSAVSMKSFQAGHKID